MRSLAATLGGAPAHAWEEPQRLPAVPIRDAWFPTASVGADGTALVAFDRSRSVEDGADVLAVADGGRP